MQTLLLVIELLIAIALVITVLMQRSEGGALGIGGGGSGLGGLFSPRGAADTLTRTTAILAILFFGICLGLNLLVAHSSPQRSILDSPAAPAATLTPVQKPATPAPAPQGPSVPTPH
ncbi:MAG: preprotein translocase subunit SecG [Alphaproteobacteria bacterium]|nr:preprotein translocase subunit SecG [Alphaproteobacteria bacterium]MDE1985295.1 preprotein translocase subunit SecG [Alphaproteobacteria bacterium]MDE2164459.1 preprotein translocase subunit SecG [Alphaproteobacteria bacterium]MDE2266950.1 preprotein translocase subunit SecG [Alphaproteobacteria bacterium]MDE2498606.1 preprotein translocase subunit SecG [Alphaproteobacteria bacterium]